MIVTTQNAEEKLVQSLNTNQIQKDDRRCVYFKTSDLQNLDQDFDLEKTIEFIHGEVDDQEGSIIVCDDGDIFILARGLGAPFVKILQTFLLPTPPTQPAPSPGLVLLFEVRVDRYKILKIIEKKLIEKEKQKKKDLEEHKIDQGEKNRQKILNMEVSANLVETLPMRRKERTQTEILVVEDDLFSRTLIEKSLPDEASVTFAEDGLSAFSQYFMKAPDILFLDIGLPDIDGHDVLAKILMNDPNAFVIMLSGKGDKDNIMKAIDNGAKGFIAKPFTREKLSQYIQKSPHIQATNT